MAKKNYEIRPLKEKLMDKILIYYSTIWKDKLEESIHKQWLANFHSNNRIIHEKEQLNALYLLSKFMYFGNAELRELLRCIYRDLYKYPIIEEIRKSNGNTIDLKFIKEKFEKEKAKTKFLGIGNPSESGIHLLYYFRQENNLSKEMFLNTHEIFSIDLVKDKDENGFDREYLKSKVSNTQIQRYIFIDDFCGSGSQATLYSKNIVEKIKSLNPNIEVNYLVLFSTEHGMQVIKERTKFDNIKSVFTIDDSFKCFSDDSRIFSKKVTGIDKDFTQDFCYNYGKKLWCFHPLGFQNGQLLLGLFHNTPDNTLPIFWSDNNKWQPIFKRYHKV
ncbi:MAG: hypothetical protein KAS53_05165 [Candidatus Cloacimonetes bacterium]|nr:hypothetical protein [Candidatus Cloacimonadota bacterium]